VERTPSPYAPPRCGFVRSVPGSISRERTSRVSCRAVGVVLAGVPGTAQRFSCRGTVQDKGRDASAPVEPLAIQAVSHTNTAGAEHCERTQEVDWGVVPRSFVCGLETSPLGRGAQRAEDAGERRVRNRAADIPRGHG